VAHIIVFGNEKGGSGKSTMSMHVATALARLGHVVGAIDLDLRQRSFTRYVENRLYSSETRGLNLACPLMFELPDAVPSDATAPQDIARQRLEAVIAQMSAQCDFIIIDSPGSHTALSQAAHSMANTLVTPLNDSFVDFDLLARLEPDSLKIKGPSVYSEMVWRARQQRAASGDSALDWVVARNRMGQQDMRNKRKVGKALDALAKRIGFRVAPGFSERVIFRELFPTGMTLLDLRDMGVERLSISNIAARQELRDLMQALNLPGVTPAF